MWIFTKHGFISVVEEHDDPSLLVVRGRVRKDLEQVGEAYFGGAAVIFTPSRDYPYRFFVSKKAFHLAAQKMAMDIDYTNFKSKVHGQPNRDSAYENVWAALHELEELNRREEQRAYAYDEEDIEG